jgi:hypothetical protein
VKKERRKYWWKKKKGVETENAALCETARKKRGDVDKPNEKKSGRYGVIRCVKR